MLTHVKCALSNLNPAVRQSCLPFISILLALFPNLVSHSLEILLPSLLGLISSIGKTSNSEGQNSKSQPQLKLEISNKDEASKQRVKVLHLLAKCLDLKTSKHREKLVRICNSVEIIMDFKSLHFEVGQRTKIFHL